MNNLGHSNSAGIKAYKDANPMEYYTLLPEGDKLEEVDFTDDWKAIIFKNCQTKEKIYDVLDPGTLDGNYGAKQQAVTLLMLGLFPVAHIVKRDDKCFSKEADYTNIQNEELSLKVDRKLWLWIFNDGDHNSKNYIKNEDDTKYILYDFNIAEIDRTPDSIQGYLDYLEHTIALEIERDRLSLEEVKYALNKMGKVVQHFEGPEGKNFYEKVLSYTKYELPYNNQDEAYKIFLLIIKKIAASLSTGLQKALQSSN